MSDAVAKREPGSDRWFSPSLTLGSVVPIGLVTLLSVQNARLKREVGELHARLEASRADNAPQVGRPLSPLTLVSPDGSKAPLSFAQGERTLRLVFSKNSGYCEQIKPDWRESVGRTASPGMREIAVFTDEPDAAVWPDAAAFACPVFGVENGPVSDLVRVRIVSATIILDDRGVIRGAWWGVLDTPAKKAQLFAAAGAAPPAQ